MTPRRILGRGGASLVALSHAILLAGCAQDSPATGNVKPLAVKATSPADGATDVAVTTEWLTVTFDEPVDCATATPDAFVLVREPDGAVMSTSVICSWDTVTIGVSRTPPVTLAYATGFVLNVSGSVRDLAGNKLGSDYHAHFTTPATPPPPPPPPPALAVTRVTPLPDSSQVPVDIIVEVSFGDDVDCRSVQSYWDPDLANLYLVRDTGSVVPSIRLCEGSVVQILTYDLLLPNTAYTTVLKDGLRGVNGWHPLPQTWHFTTNDGTLGGYR